ncbi:MAG TPA: hypothetical protein VGF75_04010, partial [Candidatus Saccharimonadales bacterium]
DKKEPSVARMFEKRKIGLVISLPSINETHTDAYKIRRLAIDNHVPLLTNPETGRLLLKCLADSRLQNLEPKSWQEYVRP